MPREPSTRDDLLIELAREKAKPKPDHAVLRRILRDLRHVEGEDWHAEEDEPDPRVTGILPRRLARRWPIPFEFWNPFAAARQTIANRLNHAHA